jgi:ferric-dicitrate binding protein FerR (iron transport regulator)
MFGLMAVFSTIVLSRVSVHGQTPTPDQTPSAEYVIEDIKGSDMRVLEEGSKTWAPAQEGQVLESGDQVKTGNNTEATLTLESETTVHLDPNTTLSVDQIAPNENGGFLSRLEMIAGNILADVKKNLAESHSSFEISANGVVCGVRGTAFEVGWDGEDLRTATHEGKVEVVDQDHHSSFVEAGKASLFHQGHFKLQRRLERRETQRFQQWRQFRRAIIQKRLQRLRDIREHRREAWRRMNPHPKNGWGKARRQDKNQHTERRIQQ